MSRSCIICKNPFDPEDEEGWTCGDKCKARLESIAHERSLEEAEAKQERAEVLGFPGNGSVGPTEAEKARAFLSGGIDSPLPQSEIETVSQCPWAHALYLAGRIAEIAREITDPDDVHVLVSMSARYMDDTLDFIEASDEETDKDNEELCH